MKKTLIIIKREYLTRVRKKSFIIMTLLGPLIMAALMIVPLFISGVGESSNIVHVVDESGLYQSDFQPREVNTNSIEFQYYPITTEEFKLLNLEGVQSVLFIPKINDPSQITEAVLYASGSQTVHIHKYCKLILANHRNKIPLTNIRYDGDTELLSAGLGNGGKYFVAYGSVVLIYFFIFLYGIQVMKGVIEEKTNRIVEVMISSVKPFQLMMGKVLGLALLGLTQYIVWLSVGLILSKMFNSSYDLSVFDEEFLRSALNSGDATFAANSLDMASFSEALQHINFPFVLTCFFVYFLGGYLLYSALFAAIGAASDADTDTQQFIFPVTAPLIVSLILVQSVIANPNGDVAVWLSQIPFTSPIIMVARIPFMEPSGTFLIELITSMTFLFLGFIFVTWIASRIYRVGILMYGKKIGYREIGKWLFYRG